MERELKRRRDYHGTGDEGEVSRTEDRGRFVLSSLGSQTHSRSVGQTPTVRVRVTGFIFSWSESRTGTTGEAGVEEDRSV